MFVLTLGQRGKCCGWETQQSLPLQMLLLKREELLLDSHLLCKHLLLERTFTQHSVTATAFTKQSTQHRIVGVVCRSG